MLSARLVFLIFMISSIVETVPVQQHITPFADLQQKFSLNICAFPKNVVNKFADGENKIDIFSKPLNACEYSEPRNQGYPICLETLAALTVISCPGEKIFENSKLIDVDLQKDICDGFGNTKASFPEDVNHVSHFLKKPVLCEMICVNEMADVCRVLLWAYEVINEAYVPDEVKRNDEVEPVDALDSNLNFLRPDSKLDQSYTSTKNSVHLIEQLKAANNAKATEKTQSSDLENKEKTTVSVKSDKNLSTSSETKIEDKSSYFKITVETTTPSINENVSKSDSGVISEHNEGTHSAKKNLPETANAVNNIQVPKSSVTPVILPPSTNVKPQQNMNSQSTANEFKHNETVQLKNPEKESKSASVKVDSVTSHGSSSSTRTTTTDMISSYSSVTAEGEETTNAVDPNPNDVGDSGDISPTSSKGKLSNEKLSTDEYYASSAESGNQKSLVIHTHHVLPEDSLQEEFMQPEDSHFFAYFLVIVALIIGCYLVIHNKQKIIALIVEGRNEKRRRPHGASYKKLETK